MIVPAPLLIKYLNALLTILLLALWWNIVILQVDHPKYRRLVVHWQGTVGKHLPNIQGSYESSTVFLTMFKSRSFKQHCEALAVVIGRFCVATACASCRFKEEFFPQLSQFSHLVALPPGDFFQEKLHALLGHGYLRSMFEWFEPRGGCVLTSSYKKMKNSVVSNQFHTIKTEKTEENVRQVLP